MPIWRRRPTQTRASIRLTACPHSCGRLNNALTRADQLHRLEGKTEHYWYAPIVADAEAGFGGVLHAFELMKAMIEAGAAGVHYEDQLAAEKKCGHLGGKVLVPTSQHIRTLTAARLAADVLDVPTLLVARTDALSGTLLTTDVDPRDREFTTAERTPEGYFQVRCGLEAAIARSLAYAPYAGHALVRNGGAQPRRSGQVRQGYSRQVSR